MPLSRDRAKLYRMRAAELRLSIRMTADIEARQTLEELARNYEELAAMLERPSGPPTADRCGRAKSPSDKVRKT